MRSGRPSSEPSRGEPARTAFAVLPPGVAVPHGLTCLGHLDRFDLAVPIVARIGVDVLLVSQKLVDAVDGWDAIGTLATAGTSPPEIWVVADGDPMMAGRWRGLATRVLSPAGEVVPESDPTRGKSLGGDPRVCRLVAVVMGSKGGVGKTTIAANLSARLAMTGNRVAAVDLDYESGDLSLRLGMTPSMELVHVRTHTGAQLPDAWGASSRDLPLTLWAAPARPELAAFASEDLVKAILGSARRSSACVVVDTPADADSDLLFAALEQSTRVILVTTLSPGAVRQARITVELLKRLNYPTRERLVLVFNRVSRRTPLSVRDASDLVGLEPSAVIPDVGQHADAEAYRGRPSTLASPRSRLSRSLEVLACQLWPETTPRRQRGLLGMKRVIGRRRQKPPPWAER